MTTPAYACPVEGCAAGDCPACRRIAELADELERVRAANRIADALRAAGPAVAHDPDCRGADTPPDESCCDQEHARWLAAPGARPGTGDAVQPVGWFVWTHYGYAHRNKLHATREDAERALESVVWHNRHNYSVRPVFVGRAPGSKE